MNQFGLDRTSAKNDCKDGIRETLLIGIVVGLTVSCKYTALATAGLLAALMAVPFPFKPNAFVRRLGYSSMMFLAAMLVASPWFIKNQLLWGNPLYPFVSSIFPSPHWTEFNAAFFAYHAGMKGDMNVFKQSELLWKLKDLITLPFRATFFPGEQYHYPHNFGAWPLGAVWLISTPLLFLQRRWTVRFTSHLVFAGFLFLLWAFTYRDTRFLLPCLVVLAPVCGSVIYAIISRCKRAQVLLSLILLYNLSFVTGLLLIPESYAPWWVVSGVVSEDEYLQKDNRYTRHRNRAFQFLKENTSPDDTVLLHGIDQAFYCPNRFIGADWFNTDPLIRMSWEAQNADELIARLKSQGVKYIVYDYGTIRQYNTDGQPFYRFFCLPHDTGLAFLLEWVSNEKNRIRYPAVHQLWIPKFINRLNQSYNSAPNVKILQEILESGKLKEIFRSSIDETKPMEGIKILML